MDRCYCVATINNKFIFHTMKTKTYHKIHYDERAATDHLQSIKDKGGKAVFKKLYSESLGKHYYEISYTFKK